MNANPAALTARADRRLPPPRRAFAFPAPLRAAPLEKQTQIHKKESSFMPPTTKQPLFDLGQLVATPGALTALEKAGQNAMEFLSRHVTGDWGNIPEEDHKENQYSLEHGLRLLSSYRTNADQIVWVITEGSRSHTTLLLPDEY
jgi:hypothetical protein